MGSATEGQGPTERVVASRARVLGCATLMRLLRPVLLVSFLAFGVSSASLFVATPEAHAQLFGKKKKKDAKDEPERLYEKASKDLKKGYYDDAISGFDKLRNTFPFSKYAVEAELAIADALFKKKEFGEASDAYRTFAKLHPKHEKVDYATWQVGHSLFLEAPKSVDRDQSSTEKALEELRSFVTKFPESKYADDASKKIGQGRDRLAAKELYVGRYYVHHREWRASLGRLRTVLSRYPDSDSAEEASFLLGKALFHTKERDESRKVLDEFLDKYPRSEWSKEARRLVARIGKARAPAPEPTPAPTPSTPVAPATEAAPAPTPAATPAEPPAVDTPAPSP